MEPWNKFRNLCEYYLKCVKYSEKSQEYLFPDQLGKSFMMPCLPSNWYCKDEPFEVPTSQREIYIRHNLLACAEEQEMFIGYPLNAFVSPDGFDCLCPVMMFPVSIEALGEGRQTGLRISIDREGISLNHDWVQYHVPRQERRAFENACAHAEKEMGVLDVDLILNYIATHFASDDIDPNSLDFTVRPSRAKNALLNTAVLFASTGTPYTKNLMRELRQIAKAPDAVLDKTALAYVFRDPPLPNEPDNSREKRIPVSFTQRPMNAGQFDAVEDSLNRPITKVMGPPGTGKSFMSVNLIANEVLCGGSVLFTSKNHKAIHAIFDKAPDAVSNTDFPLVQFCTTPDNPTAVDWMKSQADVDTRLDLFTAYRRNASYHGMPKAPPDAISHSAYAQLVHALSLYRDTEKHIERYAYLRRMISDYERIVIEIDHALTKIPVVKRGSDEYIDLLDRVESLLRKEPKKGLVERFVTAVRALVSKEKLGIDIRQQLAELVPELANGFASDKTICKEAKRLAETLKYRKLVKEWEKNEIAALNKEQSEFNYEELVKAVGASTQEARDNVQVGYLEALMSRSEKLEDSDSLVQACKDAVSVTNKFANLSFMSLVDDGAKYEKPLELFRRYLDVFPAWAATMLSLRRAAPCLPGVFTLAIIDEASQCDIPPMIPVLFRAQRAAIVGDPNQFPPVITLKPRLNERFMESSNLATVSRKKYSYLVNSAFSVVPGEAHLINEHFRCADDIAAYFNEEFYDGELSLCSEEGKKDVSDYGLKPGMAFVNATGGDEAEIEAALEQLRVMKTSGFKGTIGVISPLRKLADRMKERVAQCKGQLPSQMRSDLINTANGFQGGECDAILFLLGLNNDRTAGRDGWYITAAENKYIYNVSVSRAKRVFITFGDSQKVLKSGITYIERLIPERCSRRSAKIGYGEPRLKTALDLAGIKVETQYPVANRYLDFAIPSVKLDIEVDGMAYHVDKNGCRKADDIHRDLQLQALGWRTIRFWHHDVINRIEDCVTTIKKVIVELGGKTNDTIVNK